MQNSSLRAPEASQETPDLAFDELLRRLKREGFSASPNDYIEFTAIFRQYNGTREQFKYYLAPIVCRNKEEQAKFYRVYDGFFVDGREGARGGRKQTGLFGSFYFWLFFLLFLAVGGRALQLLLKKRVRDIPVIAAPVIKDSAVVTAEPATPHGQIFVAKKLKHVADDSIPEERSAIIPAGKPYDKENTLHSTLVGWLIVLGSTCCLLSASFFPQRRSKYLPEVDLDRRKGDGLLLNLPMLPRDHLIQQAPGIARAAAELRLPVPTGAYRLNIPATIRDSVRNYGLISPVYIDIERKPEYLFIVNRENEISYHLYRYLVQQLAAERVQVTYYYYREEGIFYTEGLAEPVEEYGLMERHGDARLIVMREEDAMEGWEEVLVVNELLGIDVPDEWMRGVDGLRDWLGDEDLFQWVCATAVYPSVKWEVLIAVGAAVLEERGALDKLNFESLVKITGIDWLKGTVIAVPVRVALLQALDAGAELAARKAVLQLVKESDQLIVKGTDEYREVLFQRYLQSFVIYSNDVRKKQYEEDAKRFMSLWDKKKVPDLATVIYLKNPEKKWRTPVRSVDSPDREVGAERFMNELLALRVISDPKIRLFFRNASLGVFMLLLLLWLFKDPIQPVGGWLIDRDYPNNAVTVVIPVNDCVRAQADNGRLRVTLNNYDNNRYVQTYSIVGVDTLMVRFEDITMAGKAPEKETFQLILDKDLVVECPYREFYSRYLLMAKGCADGYRPGPPNYYRREGNMDQQ